MDVDVVLGKDEFLITSNKSAAPDAQNASIHETPAAK